MEITAELNNENGMQTLLAKLDYVFLREEKDQAYEAYSHFDSITCVHVSMLDYIIDFEKRYNRMKKYNMTLPDAVLAFELLDTACLDEKKKNRQLCTDLKFADMKSALKTIFKGKTSGMSKGIQVNLQDVAFFTEQRTARMRKTNVS